MHMDRWPLAGFRTLSSGTAKTVALLDLLLALMPHAALAAQPAITYPVAGSTLPSTSVLFQWSSGAGATDYFLYVGSTLGANDIYGRDQGTNLSTTVTGLPANGSTLYVRLWWFDSAWHSADSTYKAANLADPVLISPPPGSTLPSASVTFTWSSGTGATQYYLYFGSAMGANDIYSLSQTTNLSASITGLPSNGSTLYVRLWWFTSAWHFGDYTYTATNATVNPVLISPAPGSTLSSSTVTFTWSSGAGAKQYYLYVGSAVGANDIYSLSQTTNLSATVTGLPSNGTILYVRLWWFTSAWHFGDYTYTAGATPLLTLSILRESSNLVLRWPTNDPALKLEYATNLPASIWISNPIPPPIVNGKYDLTIGPTNRFRLYRLKK